MYYEKNPMLSRDWLGTHFSVFRQTWTTTWWVDRYATRNSDVDWWTFSNQQCLRDYPMMTWYNFSNILTHLFHAWLKSNNLRRNIYQDTLVNRWVVYKVQNSTNVSTSYWMMLKWNELILSTYQSNQEWRCKWTLLHWPKSWKSQSILN